jgi:hypothetical protein
MKQKLNFKGPVYALALGLMVSCALLTPKQSLTVPALQVTEQAAGEVDTLPATHSVNGIDIEFASFKREGAYLTAKVCYELPNPEAWRLDETTLIIENQAIPSQSVLFTTVSDRADGFLCGEINFPVGVSPNLGRVELVIGRLKTDPHDNPDCAKAQKKLDEANTGIVIKCNSSSNSFSYQIVSRPKNLSVEEVFELVGDAFSDIVSGPWRFAFLVQQP